MTESDEVATVESSAEVSASEFLGRSNVLGPLVFFSSCSFVLTIQRMIRKCLLYYVIGGNPTVRFVLNLAGLEGHLRYRQGASNIDKTPPCELRD